MKAAGFLFLTSAIAVMQAIQFCGMGVGHLMLVISTLDINRRFIMVFGMDIIYLVWGTMASGLVGGCLVIRWVFRQVIR